MTHRIIQIADDARTDPKIVRLVAPGDQELVPLFTYLMSADGDDRYFVQISTPNRNLSQFSPSPFSSTTLSQMLALVDDERGYTRDSLVSDLRYYEAELVAKIDADDQPQIAYDRPVTGTRWHIARSDEVQRYLKLDRAETPTDETSRRIGQLAQSGDTPVPVLLNRDTLNHHVLVAGATGSGKSHLLSNISHIAADLGRAVILFDHKPDHQDHHRPNPEARSPRGFALEGMTDVPRVRYWTLDPRDQGPNRRSKQLTVRAMDLETDILAATIFHRKGEENQAETFATMADIFADHRRNKGERWTIHDLVRFVKASDANAITAQAGEGANIKFSTNTVRAIKSKLLRTRGRVPSFLDARPETPTDPRRRPAAGAEIDRVFRPGLNVIRITNEDSRAYGLFLSHLLRRAAAARAARFGQPSDGRDLLDGQEPETPEMTVVIDEAADIFQAESSYLKNVATSMLAGQIRKGRSLGISYVIAVQDAGDVPETIRHNLNSAVVGRHRHMKTLREALPTIQESLLTNAGALKPGQMYAELFRIPSLLLVNLDQSRSMLTT